MLYTLYKSEGFSINVIKYLNCFENQLDAKYISKRAYIKFNVWISDMSILLKTLVTSSQITRMSPVQSIFIRNKSRDKKYGSEGIEHGFDRGNEVRKERWIKKHMPYKTSGGEFREELGLVQNPNRGSPLYDIPDWKYVDGTPGVPRYYSKI